MTKTCSRLKAKKIIAKLYRPQFNLAIVNISMTIADSQNSIFFANCKNNPASSKKLKTF